MFGRMMSERLGKVHFWLTFLFFNLDVLPHAPSSGMGGMMRRIYDPSQYEFRTCPMQDLNTLITVAALAAVRRPSSLRVQLLLEPVPRASRRSEPVAGELAGMVGALAAAARQLRRAMPIVYRGPYEYSVAAERGRLTAAGTSAARRHA
jgi:cytochrome c oxidase subunit I